MTSHSLKTKAIQSSRHTRALLSILASKKLQVSRIYSQ